MIPIPRQERNSNEKGRISRMSPWLLWRAAIASARNNGKAGVPLPFSGCEFGPELCMLDWGPAVQQRGNTKRAQLWMNKESQINPVFRVPFRDKVDGSHQR